MNNLTLIQKIRSFILNHKIWSIIILAGLVTMLYFIFRSKTSTETRYVTSEVVKGNIVVSISGSGQIESNDTININAKASGDVVSVPVKVGQSVSRGQLIASMDSRDARIALETAQLSLDKLKKPSTISVLQKENSLKKTYSEAWNNVSSFIVDMQSVITGIEDLHNGYLGSQNKMLLSNFGKEKINLSEKAYWDAKKKLEINTALYKSLSISSPREDIDNLINISYETAKEISNTVKLSQASFDYVSNDLDNLSSSSSVGTQNDLTSWSNSVNSYTNSILSNSNSILENTQSLKDAESPADELDIRQAELNVQTKQNTLSDYYIRAPFDGVIATLSAKIGQSASGSIGTLISKQKIVKISFNEVDIAKIKLGQKATLTFDAIDELTITGSVDGIDSVGTVSQGVVTYNVTIILDVDDVRVKPGMSVSATIITQTAQDVLVVPSSAVKSKNGVNYVEVFSNPLSPTITGVQGSTSDMLPEQVEVVIGLADDISTEIITGLKQGDIVVNKTITTNASSKATNAPSILGAVGGSRTGGGTGAMRAVQPH